MVRLQDAFALERGGVLCVVSGEHLRLVVVARLGDATVEEGKVSLSDPAGAYVPEIDELQVLDGFDATGQPRTRARSAWPSPSRRSI